MIMFWKLKTCVAMQTKAWMTNFLSKEFLFFFKKYVSNEMFLTNQQLLILDGHGNHVTLEAIKQVHEFGLEIIILPSHTFRALQLLNVSCFKLSKTSSKKAKHCGNGHNELHGIR